MSQDYASPTDVTGLTITGDGPTEQQVADLLDAAYVKLKARVPGLEYRVAAGQIDRDLVEMVQAVAANPKGQRSGSVTTGPFSQSWSWDAAMASGRLTVTTDQLRLFGVDDNGATYSVDLPMNPGWSPGAHPGWCP
jgi:hypothetical protein